EAYQVLEACNLCGNLCGVNRLKGQKGRCRVGKELMVASGNLHLGEEPPISCERGSGNIFFTGCSLRCLYCQNYPISQLGVGRIVTSQELSEMMLLLQNKGAHNVNLVTPTHFVPQIIEAVSLAWEMGFDLPLVYNTSGYETQSALELLDGIIDVYLVDMRYSDDRIAFSLSQAKNYTEINRNAVKIMYSQVGNLKVKDGLATGGLIVRHLVLPDGLAGSEETFEFVQKNVSEKAWISLMNQYFPAYKAFDYESLKRKATREEYQKATRKFSQAGLFNGWVQLEQEG
ncbi:MAG: radical SAM protein, partial [candidate division Zixibacteria bacterium SM23_73_2]